jgi:uncharacterized protein (DUF302 family)
MSAADMRHGVVRFLALAAMAFAVGLGSAMAGNATPYPGTQVTATKSGFAELRDRLEAAVEANGMYVVTRASASAGAEGRGIKIAGNIVIGVFRNDFAVRMLAAIVPAGIEAPLRFYITENADGTATLTYRKPSAVFAPYGSTELDGMAAELDAIWAKIVEQATKP